MTCMYKYCFDSVLIICMYILIFPLEAEKERAATDQTAGAGLGREWNDSTGPGLFPEEAFL